MTKHTPGPWEVITEGADGAGGFWIEAENEAKTICGRGSWMNRPEESLANARLMAAAPDLLEAAKWAEDRMRACFNVLGYEPGEGSALTELRRAIAKAEGE